MSEQETQQEQAGTVNLDGQEYNINDLSDKAKYIIQLVQDLQTQQAQAKAKIDQTEMALNGFINAFREEVQPSADDDDEFEEV